MSGFEAVRASYAFGSTRLDILRSVIFTLPPSFEWRESMSVQQLLGDLARQGIKLSVKGDQLQIQAPKGALGPELRDRLVSNKAAILALLRDGPIDARGEAQTDAVPDPDKRHDPFPLTDIQRAYWLGRTGAFTIPSGIHFYREYDCIDLDVERLRHAFQKVVERHDMLRAHTLPDMLQVIVPDAVGELEELDLRALDPNARTTKLAAMRDAMSHRIYDTSRWPLHRVVAVRLDERLTRLFVSIDLINVDGGSLAILFKDWMCFYESPDISLQPLDFSYRDYVLALEANKQSASYQRSLEYWRQRIADVAPAPALPIATDPAALEHVHFEHLEAHLETNAWGKLQARARDAGVTTAIVFIAAFGEAVARFSKNARFTLNVTVFNRLPVHPDVDQIIGDFTSMLLITIDASTARPFATNALRIQDQLWEAMEHREVSGIEVQREIAKAWGEHRGALFPIVFTSFKNKRSGDLEALANIGNTVHATTQTPQLLLDHQLCERAGDAVLIWDIVSGVFPKGLVEGMFEVYTTLLHRLAHDDDAWTSTWLDVMPSAQTERRQAVNATDKGPVPEFLLHELFEQQVDKSPQKVAVLTSRSTLTYAELDRRANHVAHALRARGIGPDKLVPIVMDKGWEQIVAVFGVLKAGGAYVPLDAAGSEERLRTMIQDSEASVVLTQSHHANVSWAEGLDTVVINDEAIDRDPGRLASIQTPHHLAYVLYTSGSTGQPKGAMIEHRSVTNRMTEVKERFGLAPEDRAIALTALHHDLSVFDMFCVLGIVGGSIVLPDADKIRDPGHWTELVQTHRITLWNSVPTFMHMLVEYAEGNAKLTQNALGSLRWAIFSGDFIPVEMPDRLRSLAPGITIIGSGGPTETTVWDICYPMGDIDPAWKSIPYGKPMQHATYHIFDEQLRERPDFVPGEMYIGGVGLARGYWRDEQKTTERFITHPVTGERLYKSGDLGRWLPDGNIEILGRADFQVKIRGYRIELGEVDAAIKTHDAVRDAVVLAIGTNAKDKRLCAYVVRNAHAHESNDGAIGAPKMLLGEADKVNFKLARHGLRHDLDDASITITLGDIEQNETLLERYARRRSVRSFSEKSVPLARLGQLLQSLAPITPAGAILPKYLYPSGGSLYPVQTYVYVKPGRIDGVSAGFYYFDPVKNNLRKISDESMDASAHVSWNVDVFHQAAFVLLFVGKLAAIEPLYGPMARDFCVAEAGYMGQLLMEQAPALDLGVCPLGHVDFDRFRSALRVDASSFFAHGMFGGCVDPAQFATSALATESAAPSKTKTKTNVPVFSDELRTFLQKKLPEYMIPTAFVQLDSLPLTSNGKVDRNALRALEPTSLVARTDVAVIPPNELEGKMATIIAEVVGLADMRVDQNFFDAGATSLHIVIMAKRLREQLELDVPVTLLFQLPNIRALASALASSNPVAVSVDKAQERGEARRKARLRR